jgi:glycosyltransferase involved in cell wall biosynthesis
LETCAWKDFTQILMRIWIVSEFYESPYDTVGGYYVKGLAEKLASTQNVEVVFPSNISLSVGDENKQLKINHIHKFLFNRKNLITRTVAQLIMSLQFFAFLFSRVKRDDLVVSFTHPAFMIFASIWLKKIKKIKVIIINYDLFPEILVGTGISKGNWFIRVVQKMFDKAYNNADTIISLGSEMTQILKNKMRDGSPKIFTIPNWADTVNIYFQKKETNEIILKHGLVSKIVFSYAGTIGRCQGIEKLLDLIDKIDYNSAIHFLFFGKGIATKSFEKQISQNRNQKLITYGGFIVTEDRKTFINACDVAVISLLDGMTGLNFPSKTYNILASGHPILFVGKEDSELAEMIKTFDIGWVCGSADAAGFQKIINEILHNPADLRIKGEAARTIAEKHFAKKDILKQYYESIID